MKKLSLSVVSLILITVFISCSHRQDTPFQSANAYKTATGKTIIIAETHPVGESLSTIKISTKGFKHNYSGIYENVDPVSDVYIGDIDGNGYDEVYIITTSSGSGSYGKVLGFASNNDKSLSMIHFPDLIKEDKLVTGYMGHDVFAIEGQQLIRTFPIYNEGDTNQYPTGGTRKLIYGLYPGEAMWQLKIVESETIN